MVGQAGEGKQGVHQVTIVLGSVEELFSPPTVHPFGEFSACRHPASNGSSSSSRPRTGSIACAWSSSSKTPETGIGCPGAAGRPPSPTTANSASTNSSISARVSTDGLSALRIGIPLLLVGILLSELFRRSGAPDLVTAFVADGLLLVVVWVALWYPLTLVYYGLRFHVRSACYERCSTWRLSYGTVAHREPIDRFTCTAYVMQ